MDERILVIEDDQNILRLLQRAFVYEGYKVDLAATGKIGLSVAQESKPALIVLDLMLPDMDGIDVCKKLRQFSKAPVLMLTARDKISDRVAGLDSGADDYLVKPFDIEELLARIRALLRRTIEERPEILSVADLRLNNQTRQAMRGERVITLSAKEYMLLELFMRHPNQVLSREKIFESVWDYDFGGESNVLDVYIRYIRKKLEAEGEPRLIFTMRGVGYVMRDS